MKRLAVFTTEFPPTPMVGALRLGKLCSYLVEEGWEPVVYTVSRSAHTPVRDPLSDRPLEPLNYDVREGVLVKEIWAPNPMAIGSRLRRRMGSNDAPPQEGRGSCLTRRSWHRRLAWSMSRSMVPDEYALWMLSARLEARRDHSVTPFQAVLTSFPWASGVLAATSFARVHRLPLLVDFRDDWSSWSPVSSAPAWRRRLERRFQAKVFAQASVITSVNREMSSAIRSSHPRFSGVLEVLPQGFDPMESVVLSKGSTPEANGRILKVVYGGQIRPDVSDPSDLFDAIALLKTKGRLDLSKVAFHFFGNHLMDLTEMARRRGIEECVRVEAHRARDKALEDFARADALLMIGNRRDADWITGKVWDYLTAARPIIVIGHPDSAADRLLTETATGTRLPSGDVEGIAEGIKSIWDVFQLTGRVPYEPTERLNEYSLPNVARRAAKLLDGAIGGSP